MYAFQFLCVSNASWSAVICTCNCLEKQFQICWGQKALQKKAEKAAEKNKKEAAAAAAKAAEAEEEEEDEQSGFYDEEAEEEDPDDPELDVHWYS